MVQKQKKDEKGREPIVVPCLLQSDSFDINMICLLSDFMLFADYCPSIFQDSFSRDEQLAASSIVVELYCCFSVFIKKEVGIPIECTAIVFLWMRLGIVGQTIRNSWRKSCYLQTASIGYLVISYIFVPFMIGVWT